MTGVRKAEKGQRADAHKSCFSRHDKGKPDEYRPLFWFKNKIKLITMNSLKSSTIGVILFMEWTELAAEVAHLVRILRKSF